MRVYCYLRVAVDSLCCAYYLEMYEKMRWILIFLGGGVCRVREQSTTGSCVGNELKEGTVHVTWQIRLVDDLRHSSYGGVEGTY